MTSRMTSHMTSHMPWQNAVFAAPGLVAAGVSLVLVPGLPGVFGASLALLMVAIAWSDWRDFLVPDVLSGTALLLGLGAAIVEGGPSFQPLVPALIRAGLLAAAFLAIRVGYRTLRGRNGLGLGDVKLAGVGGAWLDWMDWPLMIEIAALSALIALLLHRAITGTVLRADTRLPFGLFLAPAIWIAWLVSRR